MTIAYGSVSIKDQNLNLQMDAFATRILYHCDVKTRD